MKRRCEEFRPYTHITKERRNIRRSFLTFYTLFKNHPEEGPHR